MAETQRALLERVTREGQRYRKVTLVVALQLTEQVWLPASPNDNGRFGEPSDWLVMQDGGDHLWCMSDAFFQANYRVVGTPQNEQERLLLIEQAARRYIKAKQAFSTAQNTELTKGDFIDQDDWFTRMHPYGLAQDEAWKDLLAVLELA